MIRVMLGWDSLGFEESRDWRLHFMGAWIQSTGSLAMANNTTGMDQAKG